MRVGMAQMLVRGGEPEGNLRRAAGYIQRAAREGCNVVVLPECLDWGWMHPGALHREVASLEAFQQAAAANSVHVVAGFVEHANGRLYNAAALISPLGEVLLRHRKLNELDLAKDLYSLGDSLAVAQTGLGRVGVLICADLFPTTLVYAEALAALGAQLILSPCAWAVEPNHNNDTEPYGDLWL
ncbi:MAG: carbon-nitrogen hydrolase family protein, partial [Bryobacterales bacterium]|nr:carbon-nitrogen hydrolase family protein [Bryobacterales bacterium]